MNGNDILILKEGRAIAGVRSQELQSEAETLERSSPSDGAWRRYVAGRRSWGLTVTYLVVSDAVLGAGEADAARDVLRVGERFTLRQQRRGEDGYVEGEALLTKVKVTATRGHLVQGSFTFKGDGALREGVQTWSNGDTIGGLE